MDATVPESVASTAATTSTQTEVELSRERAVRRIGTGGLFATAGSIGMFGLLLNDDWSLPFYVLWTASLAITGGGLVLSGLAAKHLGRFGRPLTPLPLVAAGGFGLSAILMSVGEVLERVVSPGTDVLGTLGEVGMWICGGGLAFMGAVQLVRYFRRR